MTGATLDSRQLVAGTHLSLQSKKITDGGAFCDRCDLGRIISSPTNKKEFVPIKIVLIFVGEAISLPRIQINIILSSMG